MRNEHLNNDLEKSYYSIDLYKQYKKHLGIIRYKILLESQILVVPKKVNELLQLGNFSFTTFFNYANTPRVPGIVNLYVPGSFGDAANQSVLALDRWRKPGDDSRFASYSTKRRPSDISFSHSDGFYSDGSYISLQNVSLNYLLTNKLVRKVKMQNANLFVRAENIFLISNYEGPDPRRPGLGSYPIPLSVTFGAKLSF